MDTVNEFSKICATLAVKGAISPRPLVVLFLEENGTTRWSLYRKLLLHAVTSFTNHVTLRNGISNLLYILKKC
jgi:hypothetical protein